VSVSAASFDLLPLPSGGSLLLSAHPAAWPGLTPVQVVELYQAQGVQTVVCLLTPTELRELGLDQWPELCQAHGLVFWHVPIEDQQAPDSEFECWWQGHHRALLDTLTQGHAVALHCWGGLGRTGTVASRLIMRHEHTDAENAITWVRQIRAGSVETFAQINYLLDLPPEPAP
jgi:protein-tyrosine phosphatase